MGCSSHLHIQNIQNNGGSLRQIEDRFEILYVNKKRYSYLINFTGIEKGDIYVNLIHYDKNLKNEENMNYYRYFSDKIMGSYCPFDDFEMLNLFVSKLEQIPFAPSYIFITSGAEAEKIINKFNNKDFIDYFIIFCFNKEKYSYLQFQNEKVQIITSEFNVIKNFLKSKQFPKYDLNMDNHLLLTPLFTYYEYKKGLFCIHRVISYFFDDETNKNFCPNYFEEALEFMEKTTMQTEIKNKIIEIMKKLLISNNFPKDCIKYYTGENL